jgi:CheY-like chemotaxis protein
VPKVLIADDNRNIQKVVTMALKDQGIEVIAVGHGEAAVKQLAQVMPDLILADVFMPVRNGYEVCEYVKNNEQFAHIPVVLLFGAYDPIDQKDVTRVRADGTLKKPFEQVSDLTTVVHMMLQKAAAARPAEKPKVEAREKTIELSAAEVQAMTAAKAAEAAPAEPETEAFSVAAPKIEFSAEEQPVAFGDLLGGAAPEKPAAQAEAPTAAEVPAAEPAPSQWAAWSEEASAAPAAAEAPAEEAPAVGGIEVPPREPSPDEPPIAVEFGGGEEVEIVREEAAAPAPSVVDAGPLPELATSPTDFMEAAPAAPPPQVEVPPPPAPAMDMPAPLAEERVLEVSERPVEPLEVPRFEEVAAPAYAPPPPPRVEAPPPPPPEPVAPPPAPAVSESAVVTEAPPAAAAPPADAPAVEEVVERVMARLHSGILDKITRELIRPIVEALVASEMQKKK